MRITRTLPFLFAFAFVLAACGDVGDAPEARIGDAVDVQASTEGTAYTIDPERSSISWRAAKVTNSHDGGFDTFTGEIRANETDVTSATIVIDANTITSDTERLTGHLKSEDFFDVANNPEARFELSSIEPALDADDGATHTATGNLTMAGETHSVSFPIAIERNDGGIRAKADFIIDRQNWGLTYPGKPDDLIRDEVRIMFDVMAPDAPVAAAPSV